MSETNKQWPIGLGNKLNFEYFLLKIEPVGDVKHKMNYLFELLGNNLSFDGIGTHIAKK